MAAIRRGAAWRGAGAVPSGVIPHLCKVPCGHSSAQHSTPSSPSPPETTATKGVTPTMALPEPLRSPRPHQHSPASHSSHMGLKCSWAQVGALPHQISSHSSFWGRNLQTQSSRSKMPPPELQESSHLPPPAVEVGCQPPPPAHYIYINIYVYYTYV